MKGFKLYQEFEPLIDLALDKLEKNHSKLFPNMQLYSNSNICCIMLTEIHFIEVYLSNEKLHYRGCININRRRYTMRLVGFYDCEDAMQYMLNFIHFKNMDKSLFNFVPKDYFSKINFN